MAYIRRTTCLKGLLVAASGTWVLVSNAGEDCKPAGPKAKPAVALRNGTGQHTPLAFTRIADDPRSSSDAKTTVINANGVTPADWPVLFRATFELPDGRFANCTATLVGPRVVLTAAHCADAGGNHGEVRSASIQVTGGFVSMTCRMHPKYAAAGIPEKKSLPRISSDYALCLLDEDISTKQGYIGLEYEDLSTNLMPLPNGAILVMGVGCVSFTVENGEIFPGPFDFVLRAADSRVSQLPQPSGPDIDYIVSLSTTTAQPALCPGDSGGPLMTGATYANPVSTRQIVAVNSKLTASGSGFTRLESRFAALATDDFRKFLHQWLCDNDAPIVCGANRDPGTWPCRG